MFYLTFCMQLKYIEIFTILFKIFTVYFKSPTGAGGLHKG